ncbi:uncharacterized protein SETTUDRAFT_102523 [Exserohilum turcica Et28A]|uniref:J domain-containing protein n=1 Tax=Exserohilum turcicum (strain 28A) TaxID=671987 RepID=R0J0F1_EXST2|nr:uncharacterized protein SETTUDRAFT_102523 [Exserohilum turcica Et28A]EOA90241.1 hypothetical protein SETTUDRAFT_102523 [Exserohilum turcica Et28A]
MPEKKVTDPALKEQKQEEFHRIQQAYECLGDDEKRANYDALVHLEKLRKEKAARQAAAPREKAARFDVPTPGASPYAAANGAPRYSTEHRVPTSARDDSARYQERTHYHTYQPKPTSTARPAREKEPSKSSRYAKEDRSRSEREKARTKEVRPERKFASVDSDESSDEKARYESGFRIRSEENARRKAAEERRSYEEARHTIPTHHKMSAQAEEALRYQHKSRAQVEEEMSTRPPPPRASSRDYYAAESRPSRREASRVEPVRRSSARPSRDRPSMSRRETDRTERIIPEVVDWAEERRGDERRPPMFKQSVSSPIDLGRGVPQRSYTERLPRRAEGSPPPPPPFHRSSTMPSRRKEATVPRTSGMREAMPEQYATAERDGFAAVPPAQQTTSGNTKKVYYYPVSGGGVSVRPDEMPPTARHVPREPSRVQRSPSPIGKPPIGPNRPMESTTPYKTASRPSMPSRNESYRTVSPVRASEERGRSARPKLYGEIGRDASFDASDVQYSRRYGPEDVRWAPRSGEPDKGYHQKPSLGRTATYVY